jgi:hypothetical protein
VLKVAIDEVVGNNDNIHYLPSYEYVNYCSEQPWMEDDRHVKRETVRNIITMFNEMYLK